MLLSVVFLDINDYLFENCVANDVEVASKEDAIDLLIELHRSAGNLSSSSDFKKAVMKRDSELSTELDGGIAIPHAKSKAVKRPSLAKLKLKRPVKWDSKLVKEIYMLASPDDESHIKMLSDLADALQNGSDNV